MYNLGGLKFLEKQHCLVLGVSHYCAMAATRARIRSTGKRERELQLGCQHASSAGWLVWK
jgi:hypothetical protein